MNIKSLFTCEKGCLQFGMTSSSPKGLVALPSSPSFDVGSAKNAEKTVGCVNPIDSRDQWEKWLTILKNNWVKRDNPAETDTLLIVGSADRQRLNEAFNTRFDSNVGLARARAETVKHLILEKINAEKLSIAEGRLRDEQILVLTTGPANTPIIANKFNCSDQALEDDRRVRLWMNASIRK
jgi:hypothetical protein